jgi:hypothetical protein
MHDRASHKRTFFFIHQRTCFHSARICSRVWLYAHVSFRPTMAACSPAICCAVVTIAYAMQQKQKDDVPASELASKYRTTTRRGYDKCRHYARVILPGRSIAPVKEQTSVPALKLCGRSAASQRMMRQATSTFPLRVHIELITRR